MLLHRGHEAALHHVLGSGPSANVIGVVGATRLKLKVHRLCHRLTVVCRGSPKHGETLVYQPLSFRHLLPHRCPGSSVVI
jgi:hypothetical protein